MNESYRPWASPAVIEFVRFVFQNPGSTRREILEHLWTKISITVDRGRSYKDPDTDQYRYIRRPHTLTYQEFMKNACGHLFSPYYSNHVSDRDGSERDSKGNMSDWFRTKDGPQSGNRKNVYRYWITAKGLRLLDAKPFKAGSENCHPYRDLEDYDVRWMVGPIEEDATGANEPVGMVECESTEEVPMADIHPDHAPITPTAHDELIDLSMQAWSSAGNMIHGFVEGDVFVVIEAIVKYPEAGKLIFGEEMVAEILRLNRIKELTSQAACIAESLDHEL